MIAANRATCARCGMRGHHATATECIDALRDRIGFLELHHSASRSARLRGQAPGRRGGRHPRSDNRFVVLDGQSMILADAARHLGISLVALHFRLVNRTGTKEYDGVDVRAVGADRSKRCF